MVCRDNQCDRKHIKTTGKAEPRVTGLAKSLKLKRESARDGNPEWEDALSDLFYRNKPPEVGVLRTGGKGKLKKVTGVIKHSREG